MPLVELKLLTFSEHLRSPPLFSGVRVTRSLVLYECFVDRCPFVLFLLDIVLSVLLRFTHSEYLFDIFKFFLLTHSTNTACIPFLFRVKSDKSKKSGDVAEFPILHYKFFLHCLSISCLISMLIIVVVLYSVKTH